MINSFKADIYRLLRSKGTYICLMLIALTYGLTIGLKSQGGVSFGMMPDRQAIESHKLDVKQLVMSFNYYFFLIMPVFMIVIPEFTESAYKNTITSVSDKKWFFISKFVLCEIVGLFLYVSTTFAFYFVNKVVNGSKYSSTFTTFAKKDLKLVPIMMFTIAIFTFFAFLFRKASVYNSITIVLPLVINVLAGVLCINKDWAKTIERAYHYELGSMMERFINNGGGSGYLTRCLAICIVGTVLLFVCGMKLFDKRELG